MKTDRHLLKITRQIVEECFLEGKIIEVKVTRAVKVLRSLPGSHAIFAVGEFLKGLKRKEREHTLYIEATYPLSKDQILKLKKLVEKKGKITKVLVSLNPEVLGGIKLKVGDEIWDETVAGKINLIKEAIRG